MSRVYLISVSSTCSCWIRWTLGILAAAANLVASCPASGSRENIPQIAEVDIIVKVWHCFWVGSCCDRAVASIGSVLEELVISVFTVVCLSLGIYPVITWLVDAHLSLVLRVCVNIVCDELGGASLSSFTSNSREDSVHVATSMESTIIWEAVVESKGSGDKGSEFESLHIQLNNYLIKLLILRS